MATPQYPNLGEVFKLTIDYSHPNVQPLTMVKNYGYDPAGWRYTGKTATGVVISKFQLVSVGLCGNWRDLGGKLAAYGKNPGGLWIQAFKDAYPKPDGRGRVGIFDASWMNQGHFECFPCIYSSGDLYFSQVIRKFNKHWRWLVYAKK